MPITVRRIAPSLKSSFQYCCTVALERIESDPSDDNGWKLLLLIPRMLLQSNQHGGKLGIKEAKSLYHKFLDYQWEQLVQLEKPTRAKKSANGDLEKRAAALRFVHCGELSRAARVLNSSGLAPETDETVSKLANKHPSRLSAVNFSVDSPSEGILISKISFMKALLNAPRGSGTGLSGWRFEHPKVLADNALTCDGLHVACSAIAKGTLPDSITTLISTSRLIAIPKKRMVTSGLLP